ncbi:TetR/AcrR family transcriptional regulator [Williamsia herbipolensis]|uniref:TetR/AcrR family transcriptional regulator n=1 Tax=Williamsia herbipolensis TaxID=1603258 RepID=A0AAU4JYG8_9NOCA|nr:TetR/AcrR family transcriptional regulator [Williamsia herbipolensis]
MTDDATAPNGRTYGGVKVSDRRAERRERFVAAAIDVFGTSGGYSNASVTSICATAGLSRRQFYEEFANREDALIAAYDSVQQSAEDAVRRQLSEMTPGARSSGADLFSAYLDAIMSSPSRVRLSYVEIFGVSERVEAHCRERRATWVPVIERIIAVLNGPGALPGAPGMAATAIIGAIDSMAREWLYCSPRPPVSTLVDVLQAMIAGFVDPARHLRHR